MSVVKLAEVASRFDEYALKNDRFRLAANAIDMALVEASSQKGDEYVNALANLARYATMFDLDGKVKLAKTLDVVVKLAVDLWPSAHDRNEKYDAKANNADSLFQALKDQPKLDKNESVLENMKGEALSLLTRYSPDYPGVPLMRVSDGVYQDIMTRKVYDFNYGWVGESGQRYPGGSVAHQTPTASQYLGFQQAFESNHYRSRPR